MIVGLEAGPAFSPASSSDFMKRLLRWSLFIIPLAYLVRPLGAWIHEVLGHGLVAWLCGGEFGDFHVGPWGGGSSNASAPGFEIQVQLAGAAAEAVVGLLVLFASGRLPRGCPSRVGLLCVSMGLLESACFAPILGGFHEAVPGIMSEYVALSDFGKVADHFGSPSLRSAFAVLGTVGFIAVAIGLARVLVREAEATFGPAARRRGWQRAAIILLFLCGPGFWWYRSVGFSVLDYSSYYLPFGMVAIAHPGIAAVLALREAKVGEDKMLDPPGLPSTVIAICSGVLLYLCSRFMWGFPAESFPDDIYR